MGEYVLGTSDHELQRLQLQHDVWRPITDGFLDRIEIPEGACCFDAGCGPGYLAEDLLARSGPRGSVVGFDASPRWMDHLRARKAAGELAGLEPLQGSLESLELEPASFDVIVARWVLSFLPEAPAILERLARGLRPGGTLLVIDYNHEGLSLFPPSEGFKTAVRSLRALYDKTGGDVWIMGSILRLFRAAGLDPLFTDPRIQCGAPGSPVHRWADAFFPFHTEGMVAEGVMTAEERELFLREWNERRDDPSSLFFSPIVVGAAARRPA